jgi:hypothetical protein
MCVAQSPLPRGPAGPCAVIETLPRRLPAEPLTLEDARIFQQRVPQAAAVLYRASSRADVEWGFARENEKGARVPPRP